jgi:hypothetical protein
MQSHIVSISDQILAAFSDLLQVRVTATSLAANQSGDGDSDSDSELQDVFFDSQLYLFQSAGLLIASTQNSNFGVGQALLRSLSNNIEERIQAASIDQSGLLYVHHTIMAIGDIAKGFDNASETLIPTREQAVNLLFIPATETILKALTRFEDSNLIRDAVCSRRLKSSNVADAPRFRQACPSDGREDTLENPTTYWRITPTKHYRRTNRLLTIPWPINS